jgi:hypothetical protein
MPALRLPKCGLVVLAVLAPCEARGCSIPVFRYALERWQASPYQALVFHRGPLPGPARTLLRGLEEPATPANVAVKAVDLDDPVEAGLRRVWERQGREAAPPWLVLRPPEADEKTADLWAGPLTEANVAALLDSPARRRLVEAAGRGDAVVFLLLESGGRAADDAAAALVEKRLALLPGEIVLPEPQPDGPQLRSALPLRAAFSLLRLAPGEAAEQTFVRMLLRSDEGLADVRGPIVFPIFGRGRSLGGLHGKELNEDQIRQAARFLCGACSCQVKELNPGIDLLLSANWDNLLESAAPPAPPEDPGTCLTARMRRGTGFGSVAARENPVEMPAEAVGANGATSAADSTAPTESAFRKWLWGATVGAALLTLLSGVWTLRSRGKGPSPRHR